MKATYQLSKLAKDDLEQIWNYTAKQWSVAQANQYFQGMIDQIDQLTHMRKNGYIN